MRETKESDTVSLCVDIQINKSQHVLNPRQGLRFYLERLETNS